MSAGQAHGPGIYLARDSSTSAHYSGSPVDNNQVTKRQHTALAKPALGRQVTGHRSHDPDSFVMLAICEVASVPEVTKRGSIWICPQEAAVVTRFLVVYPGGGVPQIQLSDAKLGQRLSDLTGRWTQP